MNLLSKTLPGLLILALFYASPLHSAPTESEVAEARAACEIQPGFECLLTLVQHETATLSKTPSYGWIASVLVERGEFERAETLAASNDFSSDYWYLLSLGRLEEALTAFQVRKRGSSAVPEPYNIQGFLMLQIETQLRRGEIVPAIQTARSYSGNQRERTFPEQKIFKWLFDREDFDQVFNLLKARGVISLGNEPGFKSGALIRLARAQIIRNLVDEADATIAAIGPMTTRCRLITSLAMVISRNGGDDQARSRLHGLASDILDKGVEGEVLTCLPHVFDALQTLEDSSGALEYSRDAARQMAALEATESGLPADRYAAWSRIAMIMDAAGEADEAAKITENWLSGPYFNATDHLKYLIYEADYLKYLLTGGTEKARVNLERMFPGSSFKPSGGEINDLALRLIDYGLLDEVLEYLRYAGNASWEVHEALAYADPGLARDVLDLVSETEFNSKTKVRIASLYARLLVASGEQAEARKLLKDVGGEIVEGTSESDLESDAQSLILLYEAQREVGFDEDAQVTLRQAYVSVQRLESYARVRTLFDLFYTVARLPE